MFSVIIIVMKNWIFILMDQREKERERKREGGKTEKFCV
jgi:hypothetical protein